MAAQLPVPMRPFFQREQYLGRPSANKNWRRRLRSHIAFVFALVRSVRVIVGHEINLARKIDQVGVTSVAGFRAADLSVGSDDVDTGTTTRVGDSSPQYFMCDGSHVASSEK